MKITGIEYRRCSCGDFLKTTSRGAILDHEHSGHNVPLKHYTEEEANEIKRGREK
jgi:hypothetical protein